MYLLDTVVLSELRRKQRNPGVVGWISAQASTDLFLSVVTIGEIERGIMQQQKRNAVFARELGKWLDQVLSLYADRILPIDRSVARRWGRLSAKIGHDGADLLIAATALEKGLTVVTRNLCHFEPTGVAVFNPFTESHG
ncbi:type II toxin-antitoxin system VapC family toxin [Thiorhodovibrio frisius]|uniref:Ribonuclease VapC n=1 Tax=Thiorhodovibrio frisius TaxID=631362 RepID=H8Z0F5_9GAMM|nr:type II toxin-antitoxin system VapC family toxin [Thiorhodovibrio frisius]EIC21256.1 putative nucleic acid-binding protein [Thiorhodovibrio frisius]WPL23832.1 putative ribonuclease FitB [Thiorhodovibrio frisius]